MEGNTKHCARCDRTLPVSCFRTNRSHSDGLQTSCADCVKEYNAAYYKRTKHRHAQQRAASKERARLDARAKLWELLTRSACVDCGEQDPVTLEFDHRGGKVAGVGKMVIDGHRWSSIEAEIAKCDLVCANCHRRRTSRQQGWWHLSVDAVA